MPIEKSDFLTHYYVDEPFRTISDLTPSQTEQVLAEIAKRRKLEFRLSKSDYLPRRRRIEQAMRRGFIAKNGKPKREHPHYMILGTFAPWEEARPEYRSNLNIRLLGELVEHQPQRLGRVVAWAHAPPNRYNN